MLGGIAGRLLLGDLSRSSGADLLLLLLDLLLRLRQDLLWRLAGLAGGQARDSGIADEPLRLLLLLLLRLGRLLLLKWLLLLLWGGGYQLTLRSLDELKDLLGRLLLLLRDGELLRQHLHLLWLWSGRFYGSRRYRPTRTRDGAVGYQRTAALVVLELLLLPLLALRRALATGDAADHTAGRGERGGRTDGGGIELSIASNSYSACAAAAGHCRRTADGGGCNGVAAEDLMAQLLLLLLLLLGGPLSALLQKDNRQVPRT